MVTPAARRMLQPVKHALQGRRFRGSADYWERRYAEGGGSGAGSEGTLARYKADVLNKFVADNNVTSIVEFGCGDGQQLELAEYPRYLGLDVSPTIVASCITKFVEDAGKSFSVHDTMNFADPARFIHADLTMSLDVIFHLVEDDVFDAYMRHLFSAADRFVIVYSSNEDVAREALHYRQRAFTPWVEEHQSEWQLREKIDNPHKGPEGVADFYVYERANS